MENVAGVGAWGWSGRNTCASVFPSAWMAACTDKRASCCSEICSTGECFGFSTGAVAPPSRVKITWPTLIFEPSLTFISLTVPVTEEGTSMTALSVSSSITGWPSETLAPGEIISRTRSPWSMFSPNSGSLNSLAPVAANGAEAAEDEGLASAGTGVAVFAAGAEEGFDADGFAGTFGSAVLPSGALLSLVLSSPVLTLAPAPFSTVKMTWPTLIFCPSLTRISFTVPVTEDGTSTTALSVSNSITGWPSVTLAPGEIIRRTRSPWSIFSPSSGSLNSVTEHSLPSSALVAPASLRLSRARLALDGEGGTTSRPAALTAALSSKYLPD